MSREDAQVEMVMEVSDDSCDQGFDWPATTASRNHRSEGFDTAAPTASLSSPSSPSLSSPVSSPLPSLLLAFLIAA
ncbi:hypothetical protein HN51_031158, partial [Arachis hypogaea]